MNARPSACRACGLGPLIPRLRWRAGERDGLEHYGRGLCRGCWRRARAGESLAGFERMRRPQAELLAEYERLADEGHRLGDIAERLGMTRAALDNALSRAVRAGRVERRQRVRKPLPQPLGSAELARLRALVGAS